MGASSVTPPVWLPKSTNVFSTVLSCLTSPLITAGFNVVVPGSRAKKSMQTSFDTPVR